MVGRDQPKNYSRDAEAQEGIINSAGKELRELRLGIESDFKKHPVLAIDEVATRLGITEGAVIINDYKGEQFSRMRRSAIEREKDNPALLSQKTIDEIGARTTENGPCRIERLEIEDRGDRGKIVTYILVDKHNEPVAGIEYYELSDAEMARNAGKGYPHENEAYMTITLYSQVLEDDPPDFLHENKWRGEAWLTALASGKWHYRINNGEAIPMFGVETNGELTLLVSEENSANPIDGVTPEGVTSESDGLYVYYGETVFSGTRELAAIASRKDGSVIDEHPGEEGR